MGQKKNLKYPKIEDYTLIGDSCAAALVSRYGSIAWCCIPNFNSPSVFSAILDDQMGGDFSIIPETDFESSQCYIVVFEIFGISTWWFGMGIGFLHGLFVLSIGLEILGFIHPRMANPSRGPTPTKQLQPPGFFALNYGRWTPLVTIISHMVFGGILGLFYQ